jgi:hypothetical protein
MPSRMPHDGVLVRLGRSDIHGIGVFACTRIEAGTNVFETDQRPIAWVPSSVLEDPSLPEWQRAFYRDFSIRRGSELGCPANFNLLTVGWYVNEPKPGEEANLTSTSSYELLALRDIEAGEELTILYSDFERAK